MSQVKPSRPWIAAAIVTGAAAVFLLLVLVLYLWRVEEVSGGSPPESDTIFLSTLATMLAVLIAGAFIFTTFRVDAEARLIAEQTARDTAQKIAKATVGSVVRESELFQKPGTITNLASDELSQTIDVPNGGD